MIVLGSLGIVYISTGFLLDKVIKGPSPELFLEIPPYRVPSLRVVFKKTLARVKSFLLEAIPFLFAGVIVINFLYVIGFVDLLGTFMSPLMTGWLGLPPDASTAILIGFLRKDLAVGMLISLGLTPWQLVVSMMVLSMSFPCIATFVVMLKELGVRDMLFASTVMIVLALLVGGLFNFIGMVV